MGKVVLLGAGPGDPLLLTLRGKEYIEQADCIVYDRLASGELLAYAKQDCQLVYVGKENHHHTMRQEDINLLLVKKAKEYNLVVRLKGGDPYVFGRGGEEALVLKENAVEVEIVPGISSVIAALADAGIPITHRGLAKGFQVVTAHSRKDQPTDIDYTKLLDPTITYLFLMGLSHVEEIVNCLMKAGRNRETPVAVISNGTTVKQRKCVGNLGDIYQKVCEAGLESPAIIVVGNVVTLSDKLDFFESRPLFGKRFVVPYIERFCFAFHQEKNFAKKYKLFESELESELRERGADIISVKIGSIVPVAISKEVFLETLQSDWIVFTSQNGVNAFLWNLKNHDLDIRAIAHAKIAVVGKKTGAALERVALRADFIPDVQTGQSLGQQLMEVLDKSNAKLDSTKISWFAAKESNKEIEQILQKRCVFQKIVCYENCVENDGSAYEGVDWNAYDGIFFTSGSSVKRFVELSKGVTPDNIYSIGPNCSEVIRKELGKSYQEAEISSYEGLLKLVENNE